MPGDITELLSQWQHGHPSALAKLIPIVYTELRNLARAHLRRHRKQSLLQPTALVHEAWLKLEHRQDLDLPSRTQFYALAARVIRDVLVDHCRRQRAAKRGGSEIRVELEDANPAQNARQLDLLVLDDAIRRLGQIKQRYTHILELRFFAGLNIGETAEALQISHATVEREWNFARSWLRRELGRGSPEE
jgi:RNA polymerase sigma factor (TIGR02999 family)